MVQSGCILHNAADVAAKRLLGSELIRVIDGRQIRCRIVETEAYAQFDAASHSYRGVTSRNQVMFGPAGRAYVYFTYGMHHCFNIVVGEEGDGSAVLIRALEPIEGLSIIQNNRRGITNIYQLTNGPAKLCQALQIDKAFNDHELDKKPLYVHINDKISDDKIVTTTRIGIKEDVARLWRFYIKDNPYVSRT